MCKPTRPTFNNFTSPLPLPRDSRQYSSVLRLDFALLVNGTPIVIAAPRRPLHHGCRRGRLGLHLQDGDGRRVGLGIFVIEDEDLASR